MITFPAEGLRLPKQRKKNHESLGVNTYVGVVRRIVNDGRQEKILYEKSDITCSEIRS